MWVGWSLRRKLLGERPLVQLRGYFGDFGGGMIHECLQKWEVNAISCANETLVFDDRDIYVYVLGHKECKGWGV